jgi:hypothetical protein
MYDRVQAEAEPLARYIQSIRDAALVFRIDETESQVVARIVEGLSPTQSARFVFQAPLSGFRAVGRLRPEHYVRRPDAENSRRDGTR